MAALQKITAKAVCNVVTRTMTVRSKVKKKPLKVKYTVFVFEDSSRQTSSTTAMLAAAKYYRRLLFSVSDKSRALIINYRLVAFSKQLSSAVTSVNSVLEVF